MAVTDANLVRDWLRRGVPGGVVLEWIDYLERPPTSRPPEGVQTS